MGPRNSANKRVVIRMLWAGMAALSAAAGTGLGPSRAWSAEPDVVARVNGDPVTRGELQRMAADPGTTRQLQQELAARKPDRRELERLAFRKLVIGRLLLQEAQRRNLTVTEEELDGATTVWRHRFKDVAAFQEWLKANGLDETSLREMVRAEMMMSRARAALVQEVRVTEPQVQEYYDTHREDLKTSEEVRLRIIAVEDPAAAEKIQVAFRSGEEFERLARERPAGFRVAQGGDNGWISVQSLTPSLRETVDALKVGEIGGPVPRDGELLIVRLEERRPARTKSLAEARRDIERYLLATKREAVILAWLSEQEKQAKVEIVKH
jgi:foldase protein PrsA